MTTSSPAEELKAAAEKLRKLAIAATPGEWSVDSSLVYGHRVGTSNGDWWVARTGEYDETYCREDATWIAAMHPRVGLALADWLDSEATYWAAVYIGQPMPDRDHHSLTLARALRPA